VTPDFFFRSIISITTTHGKLVKHLPLWDFLITNHAGHSENHLQFSHLPFSQGLTFSSHQPRHHTSAYSSSRPTLLPPNKEQSDGIGWGRFSHPNQFFVSGVRRARRSQFLPLIPSTMLQLLMSYEQGNIGSLSSLPIPGEINYVA